MGRGWEERDSNDTLRLGSRLWHYLFKSDGIVSIVKSRKRRLKLSSVGDLERMFVAFMRAVSLRPIETVRRRAPDGLYHITLRSGPVGVVIEEPNSHGCYRMGNSPWMTLCWESEHLEAAVIEVEKLCPGVSRDRLRVALRQLMVDAFENKVASGTPMPGTPRTADSEHPAGLDSILDLVDISDLSRQLVRTVEDLKLLAVPQAVYVPIEGLRMSGSMTVGEVELHERVAGCELDSVVPLLSDDDQESVLRALQDSTCYARVDSVGDDSYVTTDARRRVQQAVHVLNFCLSSPMYRPSWQPIRIAPVVLNSTSTCSGAGVARVGVAQSHASARVLELNRQRLLGLMDQDEESLNNLLACYGSPGEIGERIQRALTWYSNAVDADTIEERFVDLAIALECLLIGDEGRGPHATSGSITQRLAERVAFLLGNDLQSRSEKARETKAVYAKRSAIVHRGATASAEELHTIDQLVREAILAFLARDFDGWQAFLEWIAKEKYSRKAEEE
jgi:hypothetical protein